MNRKIWLMAILASVMAAAVALAQPAVPAGAEIPIVISPALYGALKSILLRGGALFLIIEGAKNVPGLADLFIKYPKVAVYCNAGGALLLALFGCLGKSNTVEALGSFQCLLIAIGSFFTAAGIHFGVAKLEPTPTVSGSASPAAKAIALARQQK